MALAVYPWVTEPRVDGLLLLGGAASLLLAVGLATGHEVAVQAAITALAGEFIISLFVHDAMASVGAAAYGSALLLVAELAYWSLERRVPSHDEPGLMSRRALAIAALIAITLGVGLAAAALAQAPVAGSLGLMAAGVGALVAAIAIVVALAWRAQSDGA